MKPDAPTNRPPRDTGGCLLGTLMVRHRRGVVAISLIVAVLAGVGILRLRITHDPRIFFRLDDPDYREFLRFESQFERGEPLVLALDADKRSIFETPLSEAVRALTESAWNLPYASHVLSLANLPVVKAHGDELSLAPLVAAPRPPDPRRLQEMAVAHQARELRLMSGDGTVAGIVVTLSIPPDLDDAAPTVARAVHQLVQDYHRQFPDVRVHIGGSAMITDAFGSASQQDLRTLIPLSLLCIIVILVVSLRSLPALMIAILVILLALSTGLGMAGWLGIALSAVSISGPVLIITLAVADVVHLLRSFLHSRDHGEPAASAAIHALCSNLTAVLLTSATTAVGFFCLNFSASPPLRDLGNVVGIGVIAACLYAMCLVPALASWLPPCIQGRRWSGISLADRVSGDIRAHPGRILWLCLGLAGLCSLGLGRIEFNDALIEYFAPDSIIRKDTEFIAAHLGGTDTIDYVLTSRAPESVLHPRPLVVVDRFVQWQRQRSDVRFAYAITDTLRQMNSAWEGSFTLPRTPEMAAQLLLLYELALPPEQFAHTWITMDRTTTRIQVGLGKQKTRDMLDADQLAHQWLAANAPGALHVQATGLALLWARMTHRNIHHMLAGTALALVLVSLMVGIALRDVNLGLVSLVPNLLPPLMAFGIWGFFHLPVGLALSAVGSMTVGIVVDDTLYLMIHYGRQRRMARQSPGEAITATLRAVGGSLCTTTVALAAGFLVLGFSAYRMSSQVGILCAMVFLLALAFDLILLPALLLWVDREP